MAKELTGKELAELKRLDRRILNGGKVTRQQLLRAFDLRFRKLAGARAPSC